MDLGNITSDGVFEARFMAAAERGIKLERRVRKSEPGASPAGGVASTVFWTWAEEV